MEKMELEKWKDSLKYNAVNIFDSDSNFENLKDFFKFECVKCKSKDIILQGYNDVGCGSEYTGSWGDAGFIMKCKKCGNGVVIKSVEY